MAYQLVYISSAIGRVDGDAVLAVSRRNNARDGITGLLYADGRRFLQVLEGERAAVERAYQRIAADPRHRAL
ncbi:MAG: BLUF domain-containing protein, partial [Pseudomonadota bacterium]|nr:BLUF domain-containing protein [Pseudomonadota bacterium]